jgi:oxalate decarboxylase/phosphoglucose isomerase-like protein (cupin superfamily)
MEKIDIKGPEYFLALFKNKNNEPINKLSQEKGFTIAKEKWQTALAKAESDYVAKIRHGRLKGNEFWRLHVAEISDKVACHVHDSGIEVYEIVSGKGTLFYGPIVLAGGKPIVKFVKELSVTEGDVFIVPEGYAHQLLNIGSEPLIILFACPDSHLGNDRLVMNDIFL